MELISEVTFNNIDIETDKYVLVNDTYYLINEKGEFLKIKNNKLTFIKLFEEMVLYYCYDKCNNNIIIQFYNEYGSYISFCDLSGKELKRFQINKDDMLYDVNSSSELLILNNYDITVRNEEIKYSFNYKNFINKKLDHECDNLMFHENDIYIFTQDYYYVIKEGKLHNKIEMLDKSKYYTKYLINNNNVLIYKNSKISYLSKNIEINKGEFVLSINFVDNILQILLTGNGKYTIRKYLLN